MVGIRAATLALALAAGSLAASATLAAAATAVPYGGVGQHATVMNNIYRAQQRNNNAISHVQNNIRASQHTPY